MKIKDYIYLFIILLLLVASGLFAFKYFKIEKAYYIAVKERDACYNAPQEIIIISDTVISKDTIWLPRQTVYDTIKGDTVFLNGDCPQEEKRFYSENYINPRYRLHWEAYGSIDWITFPELIYEKEIIKKTVDTCLLKPPVHYALNQWGMDFEFAGNTLKIFPNVRATLWVEFKEKYGIKAGLDYNMYHNEPYLVIGGKFIFGNFGKKKTR